METLQQSGVLCLSDGIPRGGFGTRSGVASDKSQLYERRMKYFLEFSIVNNLGWAVDALQSTSDNDALRNAVTQSIAAFLQGLAAPTDRALKVIDTYSVTCNKTNNPDSQIAAGQLSVAVAVRLLAAAQKIIVSANIGTTVTIVSQ